MLSIPLDGFVKDRVESGLAVASNLQGLWWMYSRLEEEERGRCCCFLAGRLWETVFIFLVCS